jgi:hypothetical protein
MIERWRMKWPDERMRKWTWGKCLDSMKRVLREFKRWIINAQNSCFCSWCARTSKALTRNCDSWSSCSHLARRQVVVVLPRLLTPLRSISRRLRPWVLVLVGCPRRDGDRGLRRRLLQTLPQCFNPIKPAVRP